VFSVFIIGTGKLAKNLANAFINNGIELKGVYSKTFVMGIVNGIMSVLLRRSNSKGNLCYMDYSKSDYK
jgi:hypothetical protein